MTKRFWVSDFSENTNFLLGQLNSDLVITLRFLKLKNVWKSWWVGLTSWWSFRPHRWMRGIPTTFVPVVYFVFHLYIDQSKIFYRICGSVVWNCLARTLVITYKSFFTMSWWMIEKIKSNCSPMSLSTIVCKNTWENNFWSRLCFFRRKQTYIKHAVWIWNRGLLHTSFHCNNLWYLQKS